jgi:hypothetical protein
VRVLVVIGLLALFAAIGFVVTSSCALATRDLPDGSDAETPAPPSTDAADEEFDCGCCAREVLPFLPACSGHVAFAIPAADCPKPCTGPVAYVLCEGTCYSACACALPQGDLLIDGGLFVGGGEAEDAAGKAWEAGKTQHDG